MSFICPKATYFYHGGVCTGPGYTKCVSCSSEQYGGPKAVALTTGLAAMKPWRGRVDRYYAVSRFTADASAPLMGRNGARMGVIPNFIPDEAFHAAQGPRPAFVPPEGDYFMFAGALGPHKGVNVLLEAWSGLRNRPPLVLAGIRRFDTPKSFPPGVIVAEDVPFEDVLRGWGHCLAAVVPSVWPEPVPLCRVGSDGGGKTGGRVGGRWVGRTGGETAPPGFTCRRVTFRRCATRSSASSRTRPCAPDWEQQGASAQKRTP